MQKKRAYEFLEIEICQLYDDLIRTSDGFDDGSSSSSGNNNGEWDVFE